MANLRVDALSPNNDGEFRHHQRSPTYPLYFSSRRKPRRWPLVLRFVKGAVHGDIFFPVVFHTLFAAVVVYVDHSHPNLPIHLPQSLIPSLSIVVGLMLVFRNSTSYDRFWQGQAQLGNICTAVRNLTRTFLISSYAIGKQPPSQAERADTETAIRLLLAMVYSVKSHLRQEWGMTFGQTPESKNLLKRLASGSNKLTEDTAFEEFLPQGVSSYEDHGLGLPIQLSVMLEAYIQRGFQRGWFTPPQASALSQQISAALSAFGSMETIRLTPIPVAYLIHIRQVLGLFGCVLPFAMTADIHWWTVLLVAIITFTLYGIEGIGQQLEDPFGYDKNDIKMDATVEDLRVEVMVMLDQWKTNGAMFRGT